ncbi:2-C-methyl-D-erythritol 4-phosphate cytidylyltransferase [Salimicrobium jeotgali]|uniref:2-C-methyl-D-erythritol 4-phosphate cytidylyltransferase n=1 Tax=Salimicrobium jeotgali TaxID=1230341 RepID=K2H3C8_9BACI|nr:2-C-methyl-D-erythritol 4-phosphate cytidylyltransferase [Salimicrobium jeotgali]AKG05618.1 2-C-methyl-D-erythritol 4-phosphate cytidylyltransferase [Salimicrobium jeotgali]EKE30385.1 2-C-methyl-D-erythritol 4-phosphate cytidylyltransferase [Salimicrobium jeotgali]MBM7696528.1 2-C-methyl-D-erythritol 4-phosphate cytidylyltransferase/2-C-methyl-D-erythritol 4-phosphate cytidylyltransferase/2-C-methyl-D-erythritol 2,4-cyclodiphosphate synthase [Salimicrobium jeotgali]
MTHYTAVIVAAGQGKRMRAGKNKQFLMIGDDPLIVHTLKVFTQDVTCREIVLVTNEADEADMQELIDTYQFPKISLIHGGEERQDSVYEGLKAVSDRELPVLIHDGARPFVKESSIRHLVEKIEKDGAALLAVPVTDTVKQWKDGKLQTLNRDDLWAAQTPQGFPYELIKEAHEKARARGFYATDDAALAESFDYDVSIVRGSYDNIKITTPEDLQKATSYVEKG